MPSLAVRSLAADRVTVGATLLTVTTIESVLLAALSESWTWTLTVELAGPSGNVQSKLPAPVTALKAAFDRLPPPPQLSLTRLNVSTPGSLVVKLYDFVWPSSALFGPDRVTVGATLLTVTSVV